MQTRYGRSSVRPRHTHLDDSLTSFSEGTLNGVLSDRIPLKMPVSQKPNFGGVCNEVMPKTC